MKLIVDSADLDMITEMYRYYPIDGVTTNPSLLWKEKDNPYQVLGKIRSYIGEETELHVQVISEKTDDIVDEAAVITERLGKKTYVKIPATKEGIRAIIELKKRGFLITATAIYSAMQAFLAAKAGADYVAPYVNRIDNLGYDGLGTVRDIQDVLKNNHFHTQILAASFKNTQQVLGLVKCGVDAITAAPDVINSLLENAAVENAADTFRRDFYALCGERKTMRNC